MRSKSLVARAARRSVTRILAMTCAAGLAGPALPPVAEAGSTDRESLRREFRRTGRGGMLELSAGWPSPTEALAGATRLNAAGQSCEGPCLSCAGGVIGIAAASAAIGLTCGGSVFSGGLALGACWITIVTAPGVVLTTANNCANCDRCINQPDPETPPEGDGAVDRCEPCDPTDPLADCPEPEADPCTD